MGTTQLPRLAQSRPVTKPALTDADFARAAATLGVDKAVIQAFAKVESPRGPFDADGAPSILFERHKFHAFTNGKFDKVAPDLSNAEAGGYGLYSVQHDRLARAVALDRDAALRATSWGQFQIMGFNYELAGHPTLQAFVNAMYRSAGDQLDALVAFVQAVPGLLTALRARDWPTAARLYNGKAYAINRYDIKLADAFREFGGKA